MAALWHGGNARNRCVGVESAVFSAWPLVSGIEYINESRRLNTVTISCTQVVGQIAGAWGVEDLGLDSMDAHTPLLEAR